MTLRALKVCLAAVAMSCAGLVLPSHGQQIPALVVVSAAAASAQPSLTVQRSALENERDTLRRRVAELNSACAGIDARDSAKVLSCTRRKQALQSDMIRHIHKSEAFNKAADAMTRGCAGDNRCTIDAMNALARYLQWRPAQRRQLNVALNALVVDRDPTSDAASIRRTWETVLKRGGALAAVAAQGDGPGFPGAGTQTSFNDCAVFALANAAGIPYGVVAAQATRFIRQGEWRSAAQRADPQKTIETEGLNGGETLMVANAIGHARVVEVSDFASSLRQGRHVLLNVVPANGDVGNGHEVVLTKAFQYQNETWYEMMDSNQGPLRRLYLSAHELNTIHRENGVVYGPESSGTPTLLR